jgi:predicted nucleic acid-binding protein
MIYHFDTDAVSQMGKKQPLPGFLAWLQTIASEPQAICAPVLGELMAGALQEQRPTRLAWVQRTATALRIIPFDERAARIYARLRAAMFLDGTALQEIDLQIAACAIAEEATLITGNRKHFERLCAHGLRCDWALSDALDAAQKNARS